MLDIVYLKKDFGHHPVLRGINLRVADGETTIILGPNGAGKSTLFNCIAMVLKPSSGTVTFQGEDIYSHADHFRRQLGYISHHLFLYGDLSALENLRFFAGLYELKLTDQQIAEKLQFIGLYPHRNRPVRTFSRGMKQRLSIARALLHEPQLILLDEPFTGLDRHAAVILRDLLLRLRDEGRTILMISHHLEHALEMGSRIVTLVRGRIRSELTSQEAASTDLAAHYLEVVARFEKERG